MTKILTFILGSLLSTMSIMAEETNEEWRATWVITWEHINAGSSVAQNQARVRQIMDDHVAANMNAVLWQARQSGTAYYNSSFEPWGYYAGSSDPGYDPLAYAIEQAHLRGLELHAWFNAFQAASTEPGTPSGEHPEWVCRDESNIPMPSNRALSPGMPEVRNYLVDVAMELVNNYDIDGIHLDYVRWNEYADLLNREAPDPVEEISALDGEPSDEILALLADPQSGRYLYDVDHPYSGGVPDGFSSWPEFWRASVTSFVEALHDSIQTQKPWVRLSVAALGKYNWSGWNGYNIVYQDAALWFNEGYIDQLTPMHYHWTTGSSFVSMLQGNCPDCWSAYIQPGINAGRLYTVGPGSYILADQDIWGNHVGIVNAVRNVSWVDGFQFFSYGSWEDFVYFDQASQRFFTRKTKVRPSGLISQELPFSPSVFLTQIDSLHYEVTISPSDASTEDQWYALYRSSQDDFHPDSSEIISLKFGLQDMVLPQIYTGNQNHNGVYYFAATALNRYWNESEFSNVVVSEPIPSFPPQVISFSILADDTVAVNSVMRFAFTKSMDQAGFAEGLTIEPDLGLLTFNWSNDDHEVNIVRSANLDTDTEYTVSLAAASVVDLNGVALDANGDGVAGDSYQLSFFTYGEDTQGPVIVYSHPDLETGASDFDVDDVMNMVFDENLDPTSFTDSSVMIYDGGVLKESAWLLTTLNNHSILSFKTFTRLSTNENVMVVLGGEISDTLGNSMGADVAVNVTTFDEHYTQVTMIDSFRYTTTWESPTYSGSTVGVIGSGCEFGVANTVYLPASTRLSSHKRSAYLHYQWDPAAGTHLIREYLSGGGPRDVVFDNSYILQCYVYGDGSNNKFRFAVDEAVGSTWPNHEVSQWWTIDWEGWKLLEWDLSDPSMVGTWIGNEILDGSAYRIDSFQMTYDPANGATVGQIYMDNLRVIKRMPGVAVDDLEVELPRTVLLYQNYPNPFNPETHIQFSLPMSMQGRLAVYDIRGRQIAELVNGVLPAGMNQVNFNGSQHSTGIYLVRLETEIGSQTRRMLLLK